MSCHRRLLVGRALQERGIEVLHLRADGSVQTDGDLEAPAGASAGQLRLFDAPVGPDCEHRRRVDEGPVAAGARYGAAARRFVRRRALRRRGAAGGLGEGRPCRGGDVGYEPWHRGAGHRRRRLGLRRLVAARRARYRHGGRSGGPPCQGVLHRPPCAPVDIGEPAPVTASYATPVRRDPFAVDLSEKVALLTRASEEMRRVKGIAVASASTEIGRIRKLFASTEGSFIEQDLVETGCLMEATAVGGGEVQNRSYPNSVGRHMGTEGWELRRALGPAGQRGAHRRGGRGAPHRPTNAPRAR